MTDERDSSRDTDEVSRELATVTRLPARRDDDGEVVEAEVVSEQEYLARQRWASYRQDVVTVARVTRAVVTHERAIPVWRHSAYVGVGAAAIAKRIWESRTNAVPAAMVRSAVAAGDHEAAGVWWDRGEKAKEQRHRRRMDLLELPGRMVRITLVTLAALVGLLLLLGGAYAWWSGDVTDVLTPIRGVIWLIAGLVWLVGVTAFALPIVTVAAIAGVCWTVGRHAGRVPQWMAPVGGERDDTGEVVTPLGIAQALAHLSIAPLDKAIKGGWQVQFHTAPVMVNGRGYHTVFSLPQGVTPGMIADKRDVLARNLLRAPLEVWPVDPDMPPYVELWVANAGATKRAGSPYPLLTSGKCDVFKSVPLGESQRGDDIGPPSNEANYSFGGMMGQGKSNAARVLAAGWALDPIAELNVFVFANNGDFDAYAPRLAVYRKGVEDDVARDALAHLRGLYADVAEREARLAQLGAKKVTRGLAQKHPELRPRLTILSECHELYGHAEFGKEAADLTTKMIRRSRKTGIVVAVDTQSSRKEAIPPKILELIKINACFAVKTWRSNDGFLGDGSFAAGIRATELRPEKDRGTSLVTGATAERFEIVKWYFIEVDDDRGYDAATEIIARAMEQVDPATPTQVKREPEQERDLLADVADVLEGEEKVKGTDVASRLRKLAPAYGPYERLTMKRLLELLKAREGVEVKELNGVAWVRRDVIYAALNARDEDAE
ncbi:MAG: cell division protein FtsK [Vicinamibacterales bacterium]